MRRTIFFLALAPVLIIINGCDKFTTDFDTNLNKTIQADVVATQAKSGILEVVTFPFNATDVLEIKDNSKINDYIDRLKEINVNSITATFTGIPAGQTISELSISMPSVGVVINLTGIENNSQVTLDVNQEYLNAISGRLLDTHEITIEISGRSTYAPMTLSTLMSFAVTVKAKVID
jgi:hypothetical protein